MLSHVLRPMRTAFFTTLVGVWLAAGVWVDVGGGRLVTRAKKARSDFRGGQGRVPRRPMPREGVVATMRVRGGRGGGIGGGGVGMVGEILGWGGLLSTTV